MNCFCVDSLLLLALALFPILLPPIDMMDLPILILRLVPVQPHQWTPMRCLRFFKTLGIAQLFKHLPLLYSSLPVYHRLDTSMFTMETLHPSLRFMVSHSTINGSFKNRPSRIFISMRIVVYPTSSALSKINTGLMLREFLLHTHLGHYALRTTGY